jgi:hypothetical protein
MLPKSDDRFDEELAGWFSQRGGAWSGTAAQLLASIGARSSVDSTFWPQSSQGLYTHLESHRRILQSLGVDVLLHHSVPRRVSLRPCQHEQLLPNPQSDTFETDRTSDLPINLLPSIDGAHERPADSGGTGPAAGEASNGHIPAGKSEPAGQFVKGKYADGDKFEGRVFENTGEALFAITEMRRQIQERGLDLESAVDLVISSAKEITRSCGIAVGFLPPSERTGHSLRPGVAISTKGRHFRANVFLSTLMAGEAVMIPDARKHPVVGASCAREGIGSLILVPIFRNQDVAGAMEFLFLEKRSFSADDVMDLGLIAAVISGSLVSPSDMWVKHAEGSEFPPKARVAKGVEAQPGHPPNKKASPGQSQPIAVEHTIDDELPSIRSSNTKAIVASSVLPESFPSPARIWSLFKRVRLRRPPSA